VTECLDALLSGTRLIDKIILIDNALPIIHLTFKTKGYLENSRIQYTFAEKIGAGGFYEGVKRAYEAGYGLLC